MAQDKETSASRKKKVRVTPPTGTSAAAAGLAAAPVPRGRAGGAALTVTVGDADVLDCGVCLLPLRPPIFQCDVGHVVCSGCRDKLEATGNGKCHVCGVATRGYRRCHAMEQLLDCIRVPCLYAAHGCDATPPYHGHESHKECPHVPCHCPGESCGFIGSTAALVDHFAAAHNNWPCTIKVRAAAALLSIRLRVGFNFLLLANPASDDDVDQATCGVVPCQLFLLNVTQERLGLAISVICIHPHAAKATATKCELDFTRYAAAGGSLCRRHCQSEFDVVCTDLSDGLPSPHSCFQFLLPNAVLRDNNDKDCVVIGYRTRSNHYNLNVKNLRCIRPAAFG